VTRWETPKPKPVAPPEVGNALAVRGSRRALSRLGFAALRRWLYFGAPAAFCVLAAVVGDDTTGRVVLGIVAGLLLVNPVRRTVVAGRAWWVMSHHPWRPYHADLANARTESMPVRMELSPHGDGPPVFVTAKPRLSGVRREELAAGLYDNVWFAGTPRGGVVVPSGGADRLLWARRWGWRSLAAGRPTPRPAKPRKPAKLRKPAKPRKPPKPRSPEAVARAKARAARAAAKVSARAAKAAERDRIRRQEQAAKNPQQTRSAKTPQPRPKQAAGNPQPQPKLSTMLFRRRRSIGKDLPFR